MYDELAALPPLSATMPAPTFLDSSRLAWNIYLLNKLAIGSSTTRSVTGSPVGLGVPKVWDAEQQPRTIRVGGYRQQPGNPHVDGLYIRAQQDDRLHFPHLGSLQIYKPT
jgi:hypothetical protein